MKRRKRKLWNVLILDDLNHLQSYYVYAPNRTIAYRRARNLLEDDGEIEFRRYISAVECS